MKTQKMKIIMIFVFAIFLTGCTTYVQDSEGEGVIDDTTGKRLTANILCRPENKTTIDLYNTTDEALPDEEKQNVEDLPECSEFTFNTGGYEGLWISILVKPLAWVILKLGQFFGNYGIGLILAGIMIRLLMFPMTRKTAMQSEKMKTIKPEMDKLEKKYKDKKDKEAQTKKSQEMMAIYKKNKINPVAGCLMALIQLPIFIAFFEAINRVPAIFEGKLLGFNLGTTPWFAIQNGQIYYVIINLIIIVASYYSFNFGKKDSPALDKKQSKMMMNIFIVFIGFASFTFPVAIGFYWITSTTFTIVQNLLAKRSNKK